MRAEAAWSARDTEESTAGRVASEIDVKGRGWVCDHSDYTPTHPEIKPPRNKPNEAGEATSQTPGRAGSTEKCPKYTEISCLLRPRFHDEKTERWTGCDRVCVTLRLATKPQKNGVTLTLRSRKHDLKQGGKVTDVPQGKSTHFLVPPFGQAGQILCSGYRGVRGPANAHKTGSSCTTPSKTPRERGRSPAAQLG